VRYLGVETLGPAKSLPDKAVQGNRSADKACENTGSSVLLKRTGSKESPENQYPN